MPDAFIYDHVRTPRGRGSWTRSLHIATIAEHCRQPEDSIERSDFERRHRSIANICVMHNRSVLKIIFTHWHNCSLFLLFPPNSRHGRIAVRKVAPSLSSRFS